MSELLNTILQVEKIYSDMDGGGVELQPIVDSVLQLNNSLNILQMLSLSCEFCNYGAQSSYLSIIAECYKVFECESDFIFNLSDKFIGDSIYYYLEFLLNCSDFDHPRWVYVRGLGISEDDLAYPYYAKLVARFSE